MRIVIIGSGVGGLGAACLLAKAGHDVTVLEKNDQLGGRAGLLEASGFRFDAGPSWLLMPEVFEHFFTDAGETLSDHLTLTQLDPAYQIRFGDGTAIKISSSPSETAKLFEEIETGAGRKLTAYLDRMEKLHSLALRHILYRQQPSPALLAHTGHLRLLGSLHKDISRQFHNPRLQQLLEFPAVFLGANPQQMPAFYGLLNHSLLKQGVFYPQGGLYRVVQVLEEIGRKQGVKYRLNASVAKIIVDSGRATGVRVDGQDILADLVISNAGVHHTETQLLEPSYRDHSEQYWASRTVAPAAVLLYLGVGRQYDSLEHHNLLFSQDWAQNLRQVFQQKTWPDDPSLYVCAPSRTDPTTAPKGYENLFVLAPVAAGLAYKQSELDTFVEKVLSKLEREMDLPGLQKHLVYKKVFAVDDFSTQFNSFQGSSLGLAHTLGQTAYGRPSPRSHRVKNLHYVGADTRPGIGLPMTLISAQLLVRQLG